MMRVACGTSFDEMSQVLNGILELSSYNNNDSACLILHFDKIFQCFCNYVLLYLKYFLR